MRELRQSVNYINRINMSFGEGIDTGSILSLTLQQLLETLERHGNSTR